MERLHGDQDRPRRCLKQAQRRANIRNRVCAVLNTSLLEAIDRDRGEPDANQPKKQKGQKGQEERKDGTDKENTDAGKDAKHGQ